MNALVPSGTDAAQLAWLWWVMFWVCTVVYLLVIAALGYALWKRRNAVPEGDDARRSERRARIAVSVAFALTVFTLVGLFFSDLRVARFLDRSVSEPLRIEVTGNQWWWEVEYDDPVPSRRIRTANELHIPVGRPVELSLQASDVIHSFWVPTLAGKKDLIPGRTTTLPLFAEKAGVFEGQCAEFCGLQHARMGLTLHAMPPAEFEAWKESQLQSPRVPQSAVERRGQEVFLASGCVLCHAIQGTSAAATVAPDLTHVGSRRTIAAGALPNNQEALASWILNPQSFKPGVRMPATALPPADLAALATYLASLK